MTGNSDVDKTLLSVPANPTVRRPDPHRMKLQPFARRLLAASVLALCTTSAAQAETPAESIPSLLAPVPLVSNGAPVQTEDMLLLQGKDFEEALDWRGAIEHFEKASRAFPESGPIYQRLTINRLRADIDRRMNDSSYLMSARQITTSQALDLYSEILANLNTHYVDEISWPRVQTFGTAALEVALVAPSFVDRMLPGTSPQDIADFHATIHQTLSRRNTSTRFDLRSNVAHAAQLAEQELGLSPTVTVLEFLAGAVSTLDTYTRLLSPQQLDDMFSNIYGNFVGLGVELETGDDVLDILSVIPGGPAEEAGLLPGEKITSVDGILGTVGGSDRIADLLRGPEHSMVRLMVLATDGTERELVVPRRRIDVPCVENDHFVDPSSGIAYLRLTNFQTSTSADVERKMWEMHRQGMKGLVLDLRGNPGGLLSAAVDLADRFLRDGRIVTTKGRNVRENHQYVAHSPNTWNVPLAVLIDNNSASASEIFAGAIADNQRGLIVGETSYGKGSVQGIFRMETAKFGLCLTTAKFFSPSGRAISRNGVTPSLEVAKTYVAARPTGDGRIATDQDDSVLQAAVNRLAGRDDAMISRRP